MQVEIPRSNLTINEFIQALNRTEKEGKYIPIQEEEPEDERLSKSLVFLVILYILSFAIFIVSF